MATIRYWHCPDCGEQGRGRTRKLAKRGFEIHRRRKHGEHQFTWQRKNGNGLVCLRDGVPVGVVSHVGACWYIRPFFEITDFPIEDIEFDSAREAKAEVERLAAKTMRVLTLA